MINELLENFEVLCTARPGESEVDRGLVRFLCQEETDGVDDFDDFDLSDDETEDMTYED